MIDKHVFPFSKKDYIYGNKKSSECIMCSIAEKNEEMPNLFIGENEHAIASLNLFPYNTGHSMVMPKRHVDDICDLTEEEERDISNLTKIIIKGLDQLYSPDGYNIGYNLGEWAGASICHLHRHIIPRFKSELGVMDIIGGAKVIIEDPKETRASLEKVVAKLMS